MTLYSNTVFLRFYMWPGSRSEGAVWSEHGGSTNIYADIPFEQTPAYFTCGGFDSSEFGPLLF
jgi:hypothetical protein